MTSPNQSHIPVLVREVLQMFSPKSGNCLLDATVGHGGHARAYLDATAPDGTVIGLDADPAAVEKARENLGAYGDRVKLINANFAQLPGISVNHILFDLGVGSHQLSDDTRGFSFSSPVSLSMIYGGEPALPEAKIAALNALERHLGHLPDVPDILAGLADKDLEEVIHFYGEERYAKRIARTIKQHRPLEHSEALANVIAKTIPRGKIHAATRTFQALRLAVNRELEVLEAALPQALKILKPGGVIIVISFHSLEDRIVKKFFRSQRETFEILTKKPVRASDEEVRMNPRSRSAKLRAVRKM